MKRASLAIVFTFSCATPLLAQVQQVVPTDRAAVPGNGSFLGPLSNATRRYQMVIDSGELTSLIGQPLTGVAFRLLPSATVAYPAADLTYADYDIFVGPGVDPSLRSLTFADNRAGPQTQVRDGALSITAGSYGVGSSPQPFGPDITFDTPYLYTGGDLLVELVHSTSNGTSASNDALLASDPSTGYDTRFGATWSGNLDSLTGSRGNFTVARFTAVPEPGTLGVAFGGLALLALRRRRAI
jgi:hypothetical protein